MDCVYHTDCPLGRILLSGRGDALTGLWLEGQQHYAAGLTGGEEERYLPVFGQTEAWLEGYFRGERPKKRPPLVPRGTPFQRRVWGILLTIPWGGSMTYGEIARRLSEQGCRASARAAGGAVGRNPISILIPCHRVLGAGGRLTGYAGGLERKRYLLSLEGIPWREEY